MPKNLMTRSEFARLAGVAPASVTKACETRLRPAVVGKRIDAAHPAAVEYVAHIEKMRTTPPATGLDPYHEKAIAACTESGRWSTQFLRRALGVGSDRATRILAQLRTLGVAPHVDKETPGHTFTITVPATNEPTTVSAAPVLRGQAAAQEKRKRDEIAPAMDVFEVPQNIQAYADMTLREIIYRYGTDTRFVDWLKAVQAIEAINERRLKNATTEGKLISRELVRGAILDPVESAFVRLLTDGAATMSSRSHAIAQAGGTVADIRAMIDDTMTSFIRPLKVKMVKALRDA